MEFRAGDICNLGFGISQRIGSIAAEEGVLSPGPVIDVGLLSHGPAVFDVVHILAETEHAPAIGRGVAELLTTGDYRTLDLTCFRFERLAENAPLDDVQASERRHGAPGGAWGGERTAPSSSSSGRKCRSCRAGFGRSQPPPAVTRPLTPAGERLLVDAADLFYRHGIRAIGVDTIAEKAGTTKKTLYDRFGSKDALVALYLRRRAANWQRFVLQRLDRHPAGPAQIRALFDALDEWLAGLDRGCAFVNAYAEIGGTDHPGVEVIREEKAWMRTTPVELATRAGLAEPERIGAHLHLLYEGAMVAVTAGGHDALPNARAAAGLLVDNGAAAATRPADRP